MTRHGCHLAGRTIAESTTTRGTTCAKPPTPKYRGRLSTLRAPPARQSPRVKLDRARASNINRQPNSSRPCSGCGRHNRPSPSLTSSHPYQRFKVRSSVESSSRTTWRSGAATQRLARLTRCLATCAADNSRASRSMSGRPHQQPTPGNLEANLRTRPAPANGAAASHAPVNRRQDPRGLSVGLAQSSRPAGSNCMGEVSR